MQWYTLFKELLSPTKASLQDLPFISYLFFPFNMASGNSPIGAFPIVLLQNSHCLGVNVCVCVRARAYEGCPSVCLYIFGIYLFLL